MKIITSQNFKNNLQLRRVNQIDRSIIDIEAALLGVQTDGVTNSSELIVAMRNFRKKWENMKPEIGQKA